MRDSLPDRLDRLSSCAAPHAAGVVGAVRSPDSRPQTGSTVRLCARTRDIRGLATKDGESGTAASPTRSGGDISPPVRPSMSSSRPAPTRARRPERSHPEIDRSAISWMGAGVHAVQLLPAPANARDEVLADGSGGPCARRCTARAAPGPDGPRDCRAVPGASGRSRSVATAAGFAWRNRPWWSTTQTGCATRARMASRSRSACSASRCAVMSTKVTTTPRPVGRSIGTDVYETGNIAVAADEPVLVAVLRLAAARRQDDRALRDRRGRPVPVPVVDRVVPVAPLQLGGVVVPQDRGRLRVGEQDGAVVIHDPDRLGHAVHDRLQRGVGHHVPGVSSGCARQPVARRPRVRVRRRRRRRRRGARDRLPLPRDDRRRHRGPLRRRRDPGRAPRRHACGRRAAVALLAGPRATGRPPAGAAPRS